ncbi:hypothetical protein [Blastococcus goldschmidtiae]|uniref:Restriction endonuclease type IV Mrr domain-containing protein n=1 Tax=Blastococcus goldschmidtiae TaxID=3075546 RepID=A0ABU2K8X9_9ACTN|nr:hypothetical protein [Blastococcus sp. DSM 46792]MDT0276654.1 hypothetical protein [Blastococcus sp. DSM 46792]
MEVDWGLDTVRGRVLETYLGTRPRVLVEISAGQVGEEEATVTVPIGAVRPLPSAHSAWADYARYEKDVAEAVTRLVSNLRQVGLNQESAGREVDILGETADGKIFAIEVKRSPKPLSPHQVRSAAEQVREFNRTLGAVGFVVANQALPASSHERHEGILFVRWRGSEDDDVLAAALRESLEEA